MAEGGVGQTLFAGAAQEAVEEEEEEGVEDGFQSVFEQTRVECWETTFVRVDFDEGIGDAVVVGVVLGRRGCGGVGRGFLEALLDFEAGNYEVEWVEENVADGCACCAGCCLSKRGE